MNCIIILSQKRADFCGTLKGTALHFQKKVHVTSFSYVSGIIFTKLIDDYTSLLNNTRYRNKHDNASWELYLL